jgi:ribose 5-phosphate isomerase B
MKIVFASDHAGFELKIVLFKAAIAMGYDVIDVGAHSLLPADDYPDFALAIGKAIQSKQADRGILICGSGVGASIAATKIKGIRAAVCHDVYSAHQGVEHDDMNVLVLGSRVIGPALAEDLVKAFLHATFSHEERHVRRLEKIHQIENGQV